MLQKIAKKPQFLHTKHINIMNPTHKICVLFRKYPSKYRGASPNNPLDPPARSGHFFPSFPPPPLTPTLCTNFVPFFPSTHLDVHKSSLKWFHCSWARWPARGWLLGGNASRSSIRNFVKQKVAKYPFLV